MRSVLLAAALVAATALPASAAPTTVTGRTCGMDWPSTASPDGTVNAGPVAVTDPASLAAGVTLGITCWVGHGDPTYTDTTGKGGVSGGGGPVASIPAFPMSYHALDPMLDIYVCTVLTVRQPSGAWTDYYFDDATRAFSASRGVPCALAVVVTAGGNTAVTVTPQPFAQTF